MLSEILAHHRSVHPLIHCISNYVTANDCANLLLACGASPIMAEDPDEVSEVTALCDGLVLNLGTPHPRKLEAMLIAGETANRLNLPVVFDPVGVGSSHLRRDFAHRLLKSVQCAAIRGNASEMAFLARGVESHRGVDSDAQPPWEDFLEMARQFARSSRALVIVTGETDLVTDGETVYRVQNGHAMMRLVTGAGCQLSALLGAYLASNPRLPMQAALSAVCAMGLCGETAHARLSSLDGSAAYRSYIMDAICHLTPDELERNARYEKL